MSNTFTINHHSYDLLQCCTCGVHFLLPTIMNKTAWDKRTSDALFRQGFYCPNGHYLGYNKQQEREKDIETSKGNNIITFFKGKNNDEHKLDPRPAS